MKKENFSKKDLVGIYRMLPKIKVNNDVNQYLAKNKISKDQLQVFKGLASKMNEEEFVLFASKGEIPAVKLTTKELEMIKGGFLVHLIIAIVIELLTIHELR